LHLRRRRDAGQVRKLCRARFVGRGPRVPGRNREASSGCDGRADIVRRRDRACARNPPKSARPLAHGPHRLESFVVRAGDLDEDDARLPARLRDAHGVLRAGATQDGDHRRGA
jgi:hypothetical protein